MATFDPRVTYNKLKSLIPQTPADTTQSQVAAAGYGAAAPTAPASGHQAPPSHGAPGGGSGNSLYDQLRAAWGHAGQQTWLDQYKSQLTGGVLPALQASEGDAWAQGYLQRDPAMLFELLKYSLGIGNPVYNRYGDDGEFGGLLFIPGYEGQAARTVSGLNQGPYGNFDSAGRYLGPKHGLHGGYFLT